MDLDMDNEDYFEVVLGQHVSQKLQKILPQGYSLQLVNKNPKKPPNKPELDKKKVQKQLTQQTGFNKLKIMKVLKQLKDHKMSEPFLHPVNPH